MGKCIVYFAVCIQRILCPLIIYTQSIHTHYVYICNTHTNILINTSLSHSHTQDLAAESCLLSAIALQKGTPMIDPRNNMAPLPLPLFAATTSTSFFSDHLTAFEVWLDYDSSSTTHSSSTHFSSRFTTDPPSSFHSATTATTESPTYLPILLQMLLSPTHRLRALQLLRRYLSLGSHTVNLALLVGR